MVKIYQQPFAHAGTKQVIPDASDPQGFVSNEDGFTTDYELPNTDPNYKPIERAEFNGLMNMVTEAVGELQQFGFAKWQPMQWPRGARVVEGGVVYRSLVQTSQQPPHADWKLEFGTAASRDVGESSGNVMEVGAFGLGSKAVIQSLSSVSDLSEMESAGFYAVNGDVFGGVASARPSGIFVPTFIQSGELVRWSFLGVTDQAVLKAYIANPTSTAELHHTGNILTSTGQSTKFPMTQKAVTDAINNSAIGVGQTWQDVTSSRSMGTTYTNTTGKAIMVNIYRNDTATGGSLTVDGVIVGWVNPERAVGSTVSAIVPNGSTYQFSDTFETWAELR